MLVVELAELLKELLVKCGRWRKSDEIEQVAREDSLKVINRKRYESDYHNRALSTVSSGDAREPDTKQSSAITCRILKIAKARESISQVVALECSRSG